METSDCQIACVPFHSSLSPLPVQTVLARIDNLYVITRRWKIADAERCTLCDECTFEEGPDQFGVCIKASRHPVLVSIAPFFSDRAPMLGLDNRD